MWKFTIKQDKAGEWRWNLKAGNGEIVADSAEGYTSASGARSAAENVRRNAGGADIE